MAVWRRVISSTTPEMSLSTQRTTSPITKGLNARIISPLTMLPSASCAARPPTTASTPPAASSLLTPADSAGMPDTSTEKPAKYTAATARYRQNARMVALPVLPARFWRSVTRRSTRLTSRAQITVTAAVTARNSRFMAMPGSLSASAVCSQSDMGGLLSPRGYRGLCDQYAMPQTTILLAGLPHTGHTSAMCSCSNGMQRLGMPVSSLIFSSHARSPHHMDLTKPM